MVKKLGVGWLLAMIAIALVGCGGAETHEAAVGETVRADGSRRYTVTAVEDYKGELITDRYVGERYAERGKWIVVDVTFENGGPNQANVIQAHDFELVDSSGRRYGVSTSPATAAYSAQQLHYQDGNWVPLGSQFSLGAIVQTSLVFDVAPDAKGLKLDIKPAGVVVDLERPHRIPVGKEHEQGR